MRVSNWFAAALATCMTAITAPASALSTDFQVEVTSTFFDGSIRAHGMPDPYTMRFSFMDRGGRVAICGIGYISDQRLRSNIRRALRGAEVMVDGQVYPVDLTYFAQANTARAVTSGMANCAVTPAPIPTRNGDFDFRLGDGGVWRN